MGTCSCPSPDGRGPTNRVEHGMQNVPKRKKALKNMVRGGLHPYPGYRLSETDYSSQEVRVFCSFCKDPALKEYLNNPESDMHKDSIAEVYEVPTEMISKAVRQSTKMDFVFALLYGSYYKACAERIWEHQIEGGLEFTDGTKVATHVREVLHIHEIEKWINHVKAKEANFWNKFAVTKQFHTEQLERYLRSGFVETHFGMRRRGYITGNEVVNSVVQGSGSQMTFLAMIHADKDFKDRGMKSFIVGPIHDSIVGCVYPGEEQEYFNILKQRMVGDFYLDYHFLDGIPLDVEAEIAPIDAPWTDLEELVCENGIWKHPDKK